MVCSETIKQKVKNNTIRDFRPDSIKKLFLPKNSSISFPERPSTAKIVLGPFEIRHCVTFFH